MIHTFTMQEIRDFLNEIEEDGARVVYIDEEGISDDRGVREHYRKYIQENDLVYDESTLEDEITDFCIKYAEELNPYDHETIEEYIDDHYEYPEPIGNLGLINHGGITIHILTDEYVKYKFGNSELEESEIQYSQKGDEDFPDWSKAESEPFFEVGSMKIFLSEIDRITKEKQ